MAEHVETVVQESQAAPMRLSSSPLVKLYTLDEFWALPEPADHTNLELIRGVLYMTPPPSPAHDDLASRLGQLFFEELQRLGQPGRLYFPRSAIYTYVPDTWLEPDLFYLSHESIAKFDGRPRTSADVVIELLSPGTAFYDRTAKADSYAALGVGELWLVDGDTQTIEVRRSGTMEGWAQTQVYALGEVLLSTVVAGLQLPLAAVFGATDREVGH